MREKIKVPRKVYEELNELKREIHFTSDFSEIIRKADDRGYAAAVSWLRNHEEDFKIGFAWGFEPVDGMSSPASRPAPASLDSDIPPPVSKKPAAPPAKKPAAPQKPSGGFFSRLFGKK